jgi:hypothetical protein
MRKPLTIGGFVTEWDLTFDYDYEYDYDNDNGRYWGERRIGIDKTI